MKLDKNRINSLKNEILMSQKLIDEEIEPRVREAVGRYMGDFVPMVGTDWDIMLNEVYPIIQNQLPSIFFRNPRVFLKPRNPTFIVKKRDPVSGKMVEVQADSQKSANTQSSILNYLITQIGYKKEVRKVLMDALLFPFGVLWHGYKGNFGMTEENSILVQDDKVFIQRISPLRFIKDPAVSYSNLEEARWVGRTIDMRYEDLIEDDKFDVDKKLIKGFHGYGDLVGQKRVDEVNRVNGADVATIKSHGSPLLDVTDENFKNGSASRFVRVHEVFLRPTKKEKREGKKGWIVLLTDEQEKPLRVNEWKIKAEGFPVKTLEFNPINDRMFGLSDIDTYKTIADQKNVITNLQIRNAQENTKVWVGINKSELNEEDLQAIQKGENTIVLFDSAEPINQKMFVSSPGGSASSELYLIDQRIQRNLEDKSGVTDLKRGFLQSGEESATSVKIRNSGGAARPSYRQDLMSDFLKDSLLYLNQLNKQFMPVKDAVRQIGSLDIEWSENPSQEEIQADVDVEIDVTSMLPESPEKEMAELQQALTLMIEGIVNPQIAQKIAQEGKMLNISPLIEQMLVRLKIRDPEIYRNIKDEESQGFVSVKEIREAKENVNAALQGSQIPFPPTPEDDHRAKLETYSTIANLLELAGQQSDQLNQLMMMHQALLAEIESKQPQVGKPVNLKAPKLEVA